LIDEISPIKRRFQEIYFSHFFNYFLTHSYVFRINPHATFVAPDDDENTHPGIVSHFRKGGKGDLSFYCSVIARSVLSDVAISSFKVFMKKKT
jgi:hypothetical protein